MISFRYHLGGVFMAAQEQDAPFSVRIEKNIMDKMRIEKMYRSKLHSIIKSGYKDELDRDRLFEIIRMNYSLMN